MPSATAQHELEIRARMLYDAQQELARALADVEQAPPPMSHTPDLAELRQLWWFTNSADPEGEYRAGVDALIVGGLEPSLAEMIGLFKVYPFRGPLVGVTSKENPDAPGGLEIIWIRPLEQVVELAEKIAKQVAKEEPR